MTTLKDNIVYPANCPHCKGHKFIRHGLDRGLQRYKCKHCHKTFKPTTGTPLHWLHKTDKTSSYLKAIKLGLSIRKAARFTGISNKTAFAWRHKFLSSLAQIPVLKSELAITGVSIIKIAYSAKGRKKQAEKYQTPSRSIIITHSGQMFLHKLPPVRAMYAAKTEISKWANIAKTPNKFLTSAINGSAQSGKQINKHVAKKSVLATKKMTNGIMKWMQRFRGVATKYLQQYWNWYTAMSNFERFANGTTMFYHLCLNGKNISTYFNLKNQ